MAKLEDGNLESFRPQTRNLNKHKQRGMGALEASMRKHGYVAPMTAAADGELLDGSARLETVANVFDDDDGVLIIRHDGTKPVIMVRTDIPSASTNEARAISAEANRIAELNLDWDSAELLADLQSGVDLSGIFNQSELDALLAGLVKPEPIVDPGPQIDKADELRQKWGVELGQMWQLGDHRLICGDCTDKSTVERLMGGEKADMVFTDPPYGIEWQNNAVKRFGKIKNDDRVLEIAPIIYDVMANNTAAFIWTAQSVYPQWRQQFSEFYKSTIIWNKGGGGKGDLDGDFMPVYEMALFCAKGRPVFQSTRQANVWNVAKDAMDDYQHPTQKPVELAQIAITSMCKSSGIVADFFLGSGSTMIACEQLGRQCRAVEISPAYCGVALERWADATGRTPELLTS